MTSRPFLPVYHGARANLFRGGIIPVLLFALLIPSPTLAQNRDKLVGTWEYVAGGQTTIALELRADGKGSMAGEEFAWTMQGKAIIVTVDGERETYTYALQDGVLLLSGGDLPQQIAFTRRGQGRAGSPALMHDGAVSVPSPGGVGSGGGVALELVGKWCYMSNVNANNGGSMTNECVTFYENGTYDYYRESSSSGQYGGTASQESDGGTWVLEGSTLKAQSRANGSLQYTLEKRNHPKNTGDPMLVIDGRAFVTATQRAPW